MLTPTSATSPASAWALNLMENTPNPRAAFYAAIVAASSEVNNPAKNAVNPHLKNKFADLKEVLATVKPVLARHGLAIVQLVSGAAGSTTEEVVAPLKAGGEATKTTRTESGYAEVRTVLIHATTGESLESYHRIKSQQAGINDAQASGVAITYMRRYAILSIMGIVGDEDGDGANYGWSAPKASAELREPITDAEAAELRELIADAEAAAAKGQYKQHFESLSNAQRMMLLPEHNRIKAIEAAAK